MIQLRLAEYQDWARLYVWRNHPTTREQFNQPEHLPLDQHLEWLTATLRKQAKTIYLFVCRDREREIYVGTVRMELDAKKETAEVSITVEPGIRGRGYASQMLDGLVTEAKRIKLKALVANVKETNPASLRLFADAEFQVTRVVDAVATLTRRLD